MMLWLTPLGKDESGDSFRTVVQSARASPLDSFVDLFIYRAFVQYFWFLKAPNFDAT